jgi:branched-chain amino acid transport system ATP-binding protein
LRLTSARIFGLLKVEHLEVSYGDMQALRGISIQVGQGEIVTIIGSNGSGKSTTLKTISGILRPRKGALSWDGHSLADLSTSAIVEMGIIQIPEGRQLFPSMTVLENLELGGLNKRARREKPQNLRKIFTLFPRLGERQEQLAGTLSGGEQQMLAVGRGLMSMPKILMLDEPSLGLSPLFVSTIFQTLQKINQEGITILLVEQNIHYSLKVSQRGYVLENGEIVLEGPSSQLLAHEHVQKAYLGL